MKILLINLDQSNDRLAQQRAQFNKLALEFERLPAVSIHNISEAEYSKVAFKNQREMKYSELACFLSHKKAWEMVIEKQEPCLILEDDALLVTDLSKILKDIEKLNTIDFVNLEVHDRKKKFIAKGATYQIVNQRYDLLRLYQDRSGTGGYVLFPSGAKKLLEKLEASHPKMADEFISTCYELIGYQIEPAALLQSDQSEKYGLEIEDISTSVIRSLNQGISKNIPVLDQFKYKKNRLIQQLLLGVRHLSIMHKSERREIKFDKNRFER